MSEELKTSNDTQNSYHSWDFTKTLYAVVHMTLTIFAKRCVTLAEHDEMKN